MSMSVRSAAKWVAILIRAHREGDGVRKRAAQQKLECHARKIVFACELEGQKVNSQSTQSTGRGGTCA